MIKRIIFSCLVAISLVSSLPAQVFPGDVNNDGIVNNIDLLFLGQFFQMPGPMRGPAEVGIDFSEKTLIPWGINFPGTTLDIGFADCDGNGIIDHADIDAIEINYNLEHGTPNPITVITGEVGVDPELAFDESFLPGPIPELLAVLLPINLGSSDNPVPNYSGISFTLNYNPQIFSVAFLAEFGLPWVSPLNITLVHLDPIAGKLEVAASLGNQSPLIDNFGPLTQSILIIEEDVVGINEPNILTEVSLTDVLVMDALLTPTPVVEDTVTIVVSDNSETTNTKDLAYSSVKVYPNPAQDFIVLEDNQNKITRWEINDLAGHLIQRNENISTNNTRIDTHHFANGLYLLTVETSIGRVQRKIIIQH